MLRKAGVWLTTGSFAVQSEAVNSAADTAYSPVIVAGLYLTTRPPDCEHPHGHERIEPFVSLFVAAASSPPAGRSLERRYCPATGNISVTLGTAAVLVLAFSDVAKYALYRY